MTDSFMHVISRILPDASGEIRFVYPKDSTILQTLYEPPQQSIDPNENPSDYTVASSYAYDWVDETPSQKTFFQHSVESLVYNALKGNNATIFVFSTNKNDALYLTAGLLYDPTQFGIIPRIVLKILQHISKQPKSSPQLVLLASSYAVCFIVVSYILLTYNTLY